MSPLKLKTRLRRLVRRWIIHNVNSKARWHEGRSIREILHELKHHLVYGAVILGAVYCAYNYFKSHLSNVTTSSAASLIKNVLGKYILPGSTLIYAGLLISKGIALYRLYRISKRCQKENIGTGSDM